MNESSFLFQIANRLQATTVKTTWNEASSTEPVNTDILRSSTHSHSVVNGHAHAQVKIVAQIYPHRHRMLLLTLLNLFIYLFYVLQAFSYVKPNSFSDDAQSVRVNDDDEAKSAEQEDDDLIEADTHRSSLYAYKQ